MLKPTSKQLDVRPLHGEEFKILAAAPRHELAEILLIRQ
jgi:hypothetical protein